MDNNQQVGPTAQMQEELRKQQREMLKTTPFYRIVVPHKTGILAWWEQPNGKIYQDFLNACRNNIIKAIPQEKDDHRLHYLQGVLNVYNELVEMSDTLKKVEEIK